jgi:gliding motility-associated-like protein
VFVVVQQKEKVSVNTPSVSLCAGDSIRLEARGADSYLWTPDTRLTNSGISNPTAFPTTNTTFIVIGKDEHACFSDTAVLNVIVRPKPFVNITDNIVQLLSGSHYQIRSISSEDVQRWQWLPANGLSCSTCPSPVTTVKGNITYTVSVSNSIGCSSEDSITIISLCSHQVLYMPNTFSPNYDGMNDYFFPQSNKDVVIKLFRIYNRWGQAIFEKKNFPANNYTYGWDGKFKNAEQKSDVYVYLMEIECANGNTVIKKGDVSLIR